MEPAGNASEALAPAARLLLRTLGHRLELAELEIEEARARLMRSGLLLGVTAVACVASCMALTMLVAAISWDTPYRVLSLGLLAALHVIATALAVRQVRRAWKSWQPFALTQSALAEDLRWLRRHFDED